MLPKSPSSLDYESHLHELALKSWAKAMGDGDPESAERQARRLAESSAKLWRWVGVTKLALTELLRGRTGTALSYLRESESRYLESDGIASVSRRLIARLHLELGSPRLALEALDRTQAPTTEDAYWRARCQARLDGAGPELAERYALDDARNRPSAELAFRKHVESELPSAVARAEIRAELLEEALQFGESIALEVFPRATILFDLASARHENGDAVRALDLFREIATDLAGRATWPLPHVRALERFGRLGLAHSAGARDDARAALNDYLELWKSGDTDRQLAREARRLVTS